MTRRRPVIVVGLGGSVLAIAVVAGLLRYPLGGSTSPSPSAVPASSAADSPTNGSPSLAILGTPSASAAVPVATATPAATPEATAPTTAVGFKLRKTIVAMGFPLPARPRHRYLDGWLARRAGRTYPYEETRGRAADGTLLRAHDGVDIAIPVGTPALAVFAGVVVDPTTRWKPWDPARYGKVVVVRSTEPTSSGYYAISAHLSRLSVAVGDVVVRGQLIGRTGRTGNAADVPIAHLHFELRAPFQIEQHVGGIVRRLDVFDPKPSLLAADPSR
jgi:murein DD-endopeptidase MepM/ murein hydrolase activator NlpD